LLEPVTQAASRDAFIVRLSRAMALAALNQVKSSPNSNTRSHMDASLSHQGDTDRRL